MKKKSSIRQGIIVGGIISTIGLAGPALAQGESVEPQSASGGLEDIVVTARKRSESLMSVPVAVTAVSGAELTRTGVSDLSRLSQIAPQVMVSRADSGSGAGFKIRGLGTPYADAGLDSSVGVNIDGMQAMRGNGVNIGFFDLAQIEVLKGPQALFFGKNNPAGVISLRSVNPTDRFEGYVRASYELEAEEKVVEGAISGPLTDTLKARLALRGSHMKGWLKNTAVRIASNPLLGGLPTEPYRDSNGGKDLLGRLTLLFEPTDNFSANLKIAGGLHKDNGTVGQVTCLHPGNPVNFGLGATPIPDPGGDCKMDERFQQGRLPAALANTDPHNRGGNPYTDITSLLATLTINYQMDHLTITSVTGYSGLDAAQMMDFSFSSASSVKVAMGEKAHTFSQEIRLLSDYEGPLNFTLGAYYETVKRRNRTSPLLGFVGPDPVTGRHDTYESTTKTNGDTLSGFGQLRWQVFDRFELAGGVRYTHETKDSDLRNIYTHSFLAGPFALLPVGVPLAGDFSFSDNNWSPELTASYKPNADSLIFLAYKTGYKSGGFSNTSLVQSFFNATNLRVDSERSNGFEAGLKTMLADRSIRLEATVYNYLYKGLQLSQFDANVFSFFLKNAASARIKGAEVSGTWQATRELRLNGSVTYNKATYASYPGASCYTGQTIALGCLNGAQNLTGAALTQAPRWTLNGGGSYDVAVGSDLMAGLSADLAYTGSYFTAEDHAPTSFQKGYTLFNAGLHIYDADRKWDVALIGRNLGNKYYKVISSGKPFAAPDEYFSFTPRAREIRLQIGYNF